MRPVQASGTGVEVVPGAAQLTPRALEASSVCLIGAGARRAKPGSLACRIGSIGLVRYSVRSVLGVRII
eukprot:14904232-Alexandrium_andersonii.AAC.1